MKTKPKAYLVGSGMGSLAAAAFMVHDGNVPGDHITIFEAGPVAGRPSLRLDKGAGREFDSVIAEATLGGGVLCFPPVETDAFAGWGGPPRPPWR